MMNNNRISSLILLGIFGYFLYESRKFSPFGALFPRTIVYILGVLSLILFVLSFFKKSENKMFEESREIYLPVLTASILVIAWVVLIPHIGFFITSIAFFSLITVFLDKKVKKPWIMVKRLLMTCGLVAGFYLFFAKVMQVPFPEGVLF